jgi:hypothetical protein
MEKCIDNSSHEFCFLREENREGYTKKVDIFFCRKCLKYEEKITWEGRRF